jgi:AcrR family transcriptional regulator
VPQITARAGLTTRTFFRHFADKREVLFAGEEELPGRISALVAAAPPELTPMALIAYGLRAMAVAVFEGQRDQLRTRRAVVRSDDGLRERELRKQSVIAEVAAEGFRDRGLDDPTAVLAARIAVTAFSVAVDRWLSTDDDRALVSFVDETLGTLQSITATELV